MRKPLIKVELKVGFPVGSIAFFQPLVRIPIKFEGSKVKGRGEDKKNKCLFSGLSGLFGRRRTHLYLFVPKYLFFIC